MLAAIVLHLRRQLAGATLAIGAVLFLAAGIASAQLIEGRNYDRLKNPQPTETGNKIEVIEFFSYGCPHCAEFEPYLEPWLAKLPADVAFRRVPVMFQDRWVALARVYYTLEAMDDARKLSPDVFKAIHGQGMALWNEKSFFDWAASKGLDRKKVEEIYGSFAVNSKVNRARQQAQQYNIQSVPTMVVDGKFVTGPERVGTHANIPGAVDELIAKARAERKK